MLTTQDYEFDDFRKIIMKKSKNFQKLKQVRDELSLGNNKTYKIIKSSGTGSSWDYVGEYKLGQKREGNQVGILKNLEILFSLDKMSAIGTGTGGTIEQYMDFIALFCIDYVKISPNGNTDYTVKGSTLYEKYILHKNREELLNSSKNLGGNMNSTERTYIGGNTNGSTQYFSIDMGNIIGIFSDIFDISNLTGDLKITIGFVGLANSGKYIEHNWGTSAPVVGALSEPYILATYGFSKFERTHQLLRELNFSDGINYDFFDSIQQIAIGTTGTSGSISLTNFANRKISAISFYVGNNATLHGGTAVAVGTGTLRTAYSVITDFKLSEGGQQIDPFAYTMTDNDFRKGLIRQVNKCDGAQNLLLGIKNGTTTYWPDTYASAFYPNIYFISFTDDIDQTFKTIGTNPVGYMDFGKYKNPLLELNFASTTTPRIVVTAYCLKSYLHKDGNMVEEKI